MRTWRITAADATRDQARAAAALAAAGARPGDRVAFSLGTSPALLAGILGALRTGIVPVVLNPALLPAERDALVADAEPALVVADGEAAARLTAGDAEAELAPVPLARPMLYTSGTTGRPKGVWSGVLDEPDARAVFDDEADLWDFGRGDVHLACSPLHHSVSIRFATSCLLRGGELLLLERFDAPTVHHALRHAGVTTAFMVPAHLQRLFAVGSHPAAPTLRRMVHAGAPCPPALKRQALDAFPAGSVWEFYGATEGQFTVCPPDEWEVRPGTVGRARAHRTLAVDEDGRIWCAVPRWGRWEYWRDPERTAAAWRGEAFTVGDLGRLDEDGFLYIDGRRDDLIISGGVNVYPAEVEAALADAPGVREVAVFGMPDERWGHRVCAAVVGDIGEDDLVAYARTRLAGYKCPKTVYRVDDLPRTSTGKVRRIELPGWLAGP